MFRKRSLDDGLPIGGHLNKSYIPRPRSNPAQVVFSFIVGFFVCLFLLRDPEPSSHLSSFTPYKPIIPAPARPPVHLVHAAAEAQAPHLAEPVLAQSQHISDVVPSRQPRARIGLVSMVWGGGDYASQLREASLTHKAYAKRHGYPHFILERSHYHLIWSKAAFLLQTVLDELAKPKEERLEWLVWADIDSLVTNPNIKLENFEPPWDFGDVHIMTTRDYYGLNTGAFFLRVSEWSSELLAYSLAFPYYRPEVSLGNSDQSAMEKLLTDARFSKRAIMVPQHFFNGYRIGMYEGNQTRPGGLFMHFAGGNKQYLQEWFPYIKDNKNETWNVPYEQTKLPEEIKTFWTQARIRRQEGLPMFGYWY